MFDSAIISYKSFKIVPFNIGYAWLEVGYKISSKKRDLEGFYDTLDAAKAYIDSLKA